MLLKTLLSLSLFAPSEELKFCLEHKALNEEIYFTNGQILQNFYQIRPLYG
ncbi:hypothetical protein appser10_18010 [Actinobacillus pleuropneumoniae serovar 10 str. D13039]|nr:hypothetical protein appser10_18010 [Actinobacillus pleuropneumoniae serovar 10 str. D13039]